MKLASLNRGRDGQLVVVSRDLTRMIVDDENKLTLQEAIDSWDEVAPNLETIYKLLNKNEELGEPFVEADCASPLPRSYQWADGSAYVNHVELVRKARGAEIPESFWSDPLMYQGGSDTYLAPYEDIKVASTDYGIDFEGEVAIITNDVPMGVSIKDAARHIKLIMLVNDVSLRGLIPGELGKGFGFFQSKPSSAFSPVCVTPDELGDAWAVGKVKLPLNVEYNGDAFGKADAGVDMTFNFPTLLAHAAKTRPLGAGCVIGSGTVSNKLDNGPGKPIAEGGVGYSCIAEIRMIETIEDGQPSTSFMQFGDRVKIEMFDTAGQSIFGAIDQQVVEYKRAPYEGK
jgi:fumarylacetoacetate (FAA) hydrolase